MIRRLAAVTAASVALLAGPAVFGAGISGPVSAATPAPSITPTAGYPTKTAPGTVTKATIFTGDRVGFSGGGFKPGSAISISILLPGGGPGQAAVIGAASGRTVTASGAGTFGIVLRLTVLGVTTLTASGIAPNGQPLTDVADVTVLPKSHGTGSTSPSPSASSSPSSSSGSSPGASSSGGGGGGGSGGGGGGSGGGGSGVLPKTGAEGVGPILWLGGGLVAAGAAALLVSVSRRRTRVRP